MSAIFTGEIHPLAAQWPMLPDAELESLAESIATDGLANPIVLAATGALVDGRNRLAACALAGVEPRFACDPSLDTADKVAAFIHRANAQRRMVSTGQKAMAQAMYLAGLGRRKNGRWARGSVAIPDVGNSEKKAWQNAMHVAGLVIDHAPDLALKVKAGAITLNEAATEAEAARDEQRARADAEQARRDQLTDLKENRPELARLVDAGELSLKDALLIRADDVAAEEKATREREERIAKFSRDVGFSINCLYPLAEYPDRRDQVRDELRLDGVAVPITSQLIDGAIASLNFIRDAHKEVLA